MTVRARWSPDDDATVLALRASGACGDEIAAAVHRTPGQLYSRMSHLIRTGVAKKLDPSDVCRRGGLACGQRRADRYREEDVQTVAAQWRAGKTAPEIAALIGRSVPSIEGRLRILRAEGVLEPLDREQRRLRETRVRASRSGAARANARTFLAGCGNTKDFGYVVGLMYGDAYVETRSESLILKTVEESFAAAFANALHATFGEIGRRLSRVEPIKIVGGRVYENVTFFETHLNRSHLVHALVETFGDTTKKRWRLDVDDALRRGEHFCAGVIQGLFDSDGSISLVGKTSVKIRFGSTNPVGVEGLAELLRRLGYVVSLGKPSAKGERRVAILAASQERFALEVGSRHGSKSALLEEFLRRRGSAG